MKGESIGRYKFYYLFYFDFIKKNITGRTTDPYKLGFKPKILIRKTGDQIIATYDETGFFPEQSLYFIYEKDTKASYYYVLGILNSKVLNYYFQAKSLTNKKSIAQVKKGDLDQLPLVINDLEKPENLRVHNQLTFLVERMLELHKRTPQTPYEQEQLEREITATDAQIDRLVYDLYCLTEEEVKIVEGDAKD